VPFHYIWRAFHPVEVIQPYGSRITIILKGDERLKWARTVDGYSIMRNSAGIFKYARLDASMNIPSTDGVTLSHPVS
jgi:hypothetical protein